MNDVLIAGGGLAGAAAGAALARAGVDVTIVEREPIPADKICGEFLSAEAQTYLVRLGLDLSQLGGHEISNLRLIRGGKTVTTALPFRGLGLSRKILDAALLHHAETCGAKILRGHKILSVEDRDGITVKIDGIGVMRPKTLLLATGKHEVRGLRREAKPSRNLVGFKMYFQLTEQQQRELSSHVELIMFGRGYAGLQLVEDGRANLCFLADQKTVQHAGGNFSVLLEQMLTFSPHLAARLAAARPLLVTPLTIAQVPYGFIHIARPADSAQIFRLGDQAGVIQSFTGDGMAIALHSAALAAEFLLQGQPSAAFHRRLAQDIHGQITCAGALYRLAAVPFLQAAAFNTARLLPRTLAFAANLTRVPPAARITSAQH